MKAMSHDKKSCVTKIVNSLGVLTRCATAFECLRHIHLTLREVTTYPEYDVKTGFTDLENLEKSGNLKETSESQGICDRIQSQGEVREFCCLKFIFSQIEDPNFENFLGEHTPKPP